MTITPAPPPPGDNPQKVNLSSLIPAPTPGNGRGSVSWPQVALAVVSAVLTIGMGLLTRATNSNSDRISNVVTITREQLEEARERRAENEAQIHKNEERIATLEHRVAVLEKGAGNRP